MNPTNKITQQLLQALIQQQIVKIIYQNQKGEETISDITVLCVGHQYINGYCHLRDELRTFKISRILNATPTRTHKKDSKLIS